MNSSVTRLIGRCGLGIQRHLPEILTVAGAACTVASVVFAIKKTRKVDAILEEHKKSVEAIKEVYEEPDKYLKEGEEYTEQDYKKDLVITYTKTAGKLVKLYWPCAVTGIASIVCGFASNNMMRSRNAALAAAYTVVSGSLDEYRRRVAEKLGDEVERQIFSGATEEEVVETVVDEKGKEKTVTRKYMKYKQNGYSRVFDENNPNWSKFNSNNYQFLKDQQKYLDNQLKANGWLTLAQAYEALGFEVTGESLVVGWIYDKNGNKEGDNYVDIGYKNTPAHNWDSDLADHNSCFFLDFNVDGPILDRMPSNNRYGIRN